MSSSRLSRISYISLSGVFRRSESESKALLRLYSGADRASCRLRDSPLLDFALAMGRERLRRQVGASTLKADDSCGDTWGDRLTNDDWISSDSRPMRCWMEAGG